MRQLCSAVGVVLSAVLLSCTPREEVRLKGYEEGVYLRCKPVEGRELRYGWKSTMNSTSEMGQGMTQASVTSITFRVKRKTERVSGDTVVMRVTYEEAGGTTTVGGRAMDIPGLDGLRGEGVTLVIVGNEVVKKNVSSGFGDETRQHVEGVVRDIEEELRVFSGENLLRVGDEWDLEYEEDGRAAATHYVLEGFEEKEGTGCAKLSYRSEIHVSQEQSQMGMEVKFVGQGEQRGEIYFDPQQGYKIYEKGTASIEGKSQVPVMGLSFDVFTDVTAETRLIRGEE